MDLGNEADYEGLAARVVDVSREAHALAVEHLEEGEFRHVGEGPSLHRDIGEEDGVGTGLEDGPVPRGLGYEAPAHEVLDDIRRGAAEDAEIRLGNAHEPDAAGHLETFHDYPILACFFPGGLSETPRLTPVPPQG